MAMVGTDDEATIETAIVAKYRASPQFKRAWKIISPRPEHSAECEREIVYAILSILVATKADADDRIPPAEEKKKLGKGAKKLRAAIPFVPSDSLAEDLKDEAKFMEEWADSIAVGKGKPRRQFAKSLGVAWAYDLLTRFGNKPPSRYRDGAWHELSKVLFGEAKDLFDYMETYHPQEPLTGESFVIKERSCMTDMVAYLVGPRPHFL
jgi:hypothetical protein